MNALNNIKGALSSARKTLTRPRLLTWICLHFHLRGVERKRDPLQKFEQKNSFQATFVLVLSKSTTAADLVKLGGHQLSPCGVHPLHHYHLKREKMSITFCHAALHRLDGTAGGGTMLWWATCQSSRSEAEWACSSAPWHTLLLLVDM